MQDGDLRFADFQTDHLDGATALSRQAQWVHRREDWAFTLGLSTGVVALMGDKVVGTTILTRYGTEENAAATINMVIVDEALRGRGVGRGLMEWALKSAEGYECRLVATDEGLPLYRKLGFVDAGRIHQYQGQAAAPADADLAGADLDGIGWATEAALPALLAMDRAACGMDRARLIARLFEVGRIAVLSEGGGTAGFAGLRAFGRGEVVGPIVARNEDQARRLAGFLFAESVDHFLRIDTPSQSFGNWLASRGLVHVGGGIPMVRPRGGTQSAIAKATAPSGGEFQTYGLASQALG